MKDVTDENIEQVKQDYIKVFEKFNDLLQKEMEIENELVQIVVKELYDIIEEYYGCSDEIFKIFANMYITEPGYIEILSSYDEKLPKYIYDSINIYLSEEE